MLWVWSHSLSISVVALTGSLLLPNPTLVLAHTVTWYTCAGVSSTSEAARDSAGTSRIMEDCPTMAHGVVQLVEEKDTIGVGWGGPGDINGAKTGGRYSEVEWSAWD